MENENSKLKKEYKVPPKFKPILIDLIKEILINKPEDIISFCSDYFKNKQEEMQNNLSRVTTFPIIINVKSNNGSNKKRLSIFQKKFVSQKSNAKKELIELSKNYNPEIKNKDNNQDEIKVIQNNNEYESEIFDCINFDEKEQILSELKNTEEKHPLKFIAEEYYNDVFIPNKKFNDLLILAQKIIMSFFTNKGTEQENEFLNLEQDFNKKVAELKDQFLEKNLDNLPVLDAINLFKKQKFYAKMLKCYLIKIELIKKHKFENNELIDEMCYFIFYQELKCISKIKGTLGKEDENKKNKSFENYFNTNIKLLIPEIFSFVHSINFLDEDSLICNFSNFSIRKRDLSLNYFQQIVLPNSKSRENSKKLTELQMELYISTPDQVIKALDAAELKSEEKEDEIEPIQEKIKKNNPNLSAFICKITNTPFDALDNNIDEFTELKNIEREIVLKLLKLSTDFSDIFNKLNNVNINQQDSEFCNEMKDIYFNMKYIKDLNFMYNYIFKNEIFTIPENIKKYIDNIKKIKNENFQEDEFLKEYQGFNILCRIGIFLYLLLVKEGKKFLQPFIDKLNFLKIKYESVMHRTHIESLLLNFTNDSDEAGVFKQKYSKWKETIPENLSNVIENKNQEEQEKMIKELKDENHQKTVYNILVIESLINKDRNLKKFLQKLQKEIPLIDEIKKEKK